MQLKCDWMTLELRWEWREGVGMPFNGFDSSAWRHQRTGAAAGRVEELLPPSLHCRRLLSQLHRGRYKRAYDCPHISYQVDFSWARTYLHQRFGPSKSFFWLLQRRNTSLVSFHDIPSSFRITLKMGINKYKRMGAFWAPVQYRH